MPIEIKNYTGILERGEAFLRAKCELFATDGLSIHIKYTRARGRDLNGYYRFRDSRMVLAVKRRLRFPRSAAYGVGSITPARRPSRGRPYRLVWHEDVFENVDDLFVFVAGHEVWHYLCHSGQRRGDFETRANCHGFLWLAEFHRWADSGAPVGEIPLVPPRPDRGAVVRTCERAPVATAAPAMPFAAPVLPAVPPVPAPAASAPPLVVAASQLSLFAEGGMRSGGFSAPSRSSHATSRVSRKRT